MSHPSARAVNAYRKVIGVPGDTGSGSYLEVGRMPSVWDTIVGDLSGMASWKEDVFFTDWATLNNIECITLVDVYNRVHTIPLPINWEIL